MTARNALVMLVLAALAVIALLIYNNQAPPVRLPTVLIEFSPEDVSEFALSGQGDVKRFRRKPGASNQWELLLEATPVRAHSVRVDDLLRLLGRIQVNERFAADKNEAQDLAAFGLSNPEIGLEIVVPGKRHGARFGSPSISGENVYADLGPGTDVYLVPKAVREEIVRVFLEPNGLRDTNVSPLSSVDVKGLEVEIGGVTEVQVTKDLTGVWRVSAPYRGYADPSGFETMRTRITGAEVKVFVEDAPKDLAPYGLAEPRARVTLIPRRETETKAVLLLGAERPDGDVFVMEEGGASVLQVGKRFADAVLTHPSTYRDKAFTRLGIDGVGLTVRLDGVPAYKLLKEGQQWDIVEPERGPTEGAVVARAIDQLRSWATLEFRDRADPLEFGLDGSQFIELKRHSGEIVTLLIGIKDESTGGYWAMRKGDGGPELVAPGPILTLRQGVQQFRTKVVRQWVPDEMIHIGRESATDDDIQTIAIYRDFDHATNTMSPYWRTDGQVGEIHKANIDQILAHLMTIEVVRWLPPTDDTMRAAGFMPGDLAPLKLRVEVAFIGPPSRTPVAHGDNQVLEISKPHPDGGYYARFKAEGLQYPFVISEEFVKSLSVPLTKAWTKE